MKDIIEKNVSENDEKTRIVLDAINSDPIITDDDKSCLMKNFDKWNSRTYETMNYRTLRSDGDIICIDNIVWRIQDNGRKRKLKSGMEKVFALMKADYLRRNYSYHVDMKFSAGWMNLEQLMSSALNKFEEVS